MLNYNGRALLQECLPSITAAARASRLAPRVIVIDNSSTDDSCAFLQSRYPEVEVIEKPNLGLCSYNDVVCDLKEPVAVLLNNDIKLAEDAIDPLVAPLLANDGCDPRCAITAPRCMLFDGATYEGLRAAVRWRWGLVQATSLFPGCEAGQFLAGKTASAGAVIAIRKNVFLKLGGFDPIYLPGRIEDLDLAFRAYQHGYHAKYVPESLALHRGQATFTTAHGDNGCLRLALRNTFLFQWKNLRCPLHVARHVAGVTTRVVCEVAAAPFTKRECRFMTSGALLAAARRKYSTWRRPEAWRSVPDRQRERSFFREFSVRSMQRPVCGNE